MKGDVLVIEEHHRRAAGIIAAALADRARAKAGRFAIAVSGESGSGKSETAAALAESFQALGIRAAVLGQDDYFVLPPRSNDARRRRDPEWLGPSAEVRLDLLQADLDKAARGASSIEKPLVDYASDEIGTETLDLSGAGIVLVEGTYVALLKRLDTRVFIARGRLETLEHRRRRNRGDEAGDPFVERVLAIEHMIIAAHRQLADFVIGRDYEVVACDDALAADAPTRTPTRTQPRTQPRTP